MKLPRFVRKRKGLVLIAVAALAALLCVFLTALYVGWVTHQIDGKMAELKNRKPSRFYATPAPLKIGQNFRQADLTRLLKLLGFIEAPSKDDVNNDQYVWDRSGGALSLLLVRSEFTGAGHQLDRLAVKIRFTPMGARDFQIEKIVNAHTSEELAELAFTPKHIGSFFAGRLRTEESIPLSEIPVNVRLAVMAIEDAKFLEHGGVSLRSTVRALLRDIRAGRFVEGGSTITQQLMKNLLLSKEKSLFRKIKEFFFAFITESRHSKEDILEAYLNEVYLGQSGTHEIHGVSEGARYYFQRPIADLSLSQAATLAAIIQAPNAHDPRKNPSRTLNRRNLVLKKMVEAEFILPSEGEEALRKPLGTLTGELSLEDSNYYLDLVMDRLPVDIRGRLEADALSIYLPLDPYFQSVAAQAITSQINNLEKNVPKIREKKKNNVLLEAALVAIDIPTCSIVALQGGRSYRETQFNRAIEGKRQPGSLFKPFVYLTALMKGTPQGPFTPLTLLSDEPFEWKYDNQLWKPKNYDGKFRGQVTAMRALADSINSPTAQVAQMVGIESIIETLRKVGMTSDLPTLPSLSLGAAEVTPIELAGAYTTLARLGKSCAPRSYAEILDEFGSPLVANTFSTTEALPPAPTFVMVQMMKSVFTEGTGKLALGADLPISKFAGKSGTTNEYKDAWFAGFSSRLLVLVWVGYDQNAFVGLTGSAAALPLWIDFLKRTKPFLSEDDFPAPEGVIAVEVDPDNGKAATPRCKNRKLVYFVQGTEPKETCPDHP